MNTLLDLPDDWQHADILQAVAWVRTKGTALDLGAHRGITTRLLVTLFPTVLAVEPTELAEAITPLATVRRVALGASRGRAGLLPGNHNTGQTHLGPGDDVDIILLDDLYEEGWRPDFVKMDVEGMERDVLYGGERMIRECRPVIMFEENRLCERYGNPRGSTGRLLEQWGARRVAVLRSNPPDEDWVYTW